MPAERARAAADGAADEPVLPPEFADLECFADWALPQERARKAKRIASAMDEILAFHGAMSARLEDIILYLNRFPYDALPPPARRLCDMSLSLVEVSNLVELYKGPDVMDAMEPARFVPHE
jgi:hypothetical protein